MFGALQNEHSNSHTHTKETLPSHLFLSMLFFLFCFLCFGTLLVFIGAEHCAVNVVCCVRLYMLFVHQAESGAVDKLFGVQHKSIQSTRCTCTASGTRPSNSNNTHAIVVESGCCAMLCYVLWHGPEFPSLILGTMLNF